MRGREGEGRGERGREGKKEGSLIHPIPLMHRGIPSIRVTPLVPATLAPAGVR